MVQTEHLKKMGDVDTNVGYLALLPRTAQIKWTKYQTGDLQAITFHGRDTMEMAELCSEAGYEFKIRNGEFILELTDTAKGQEIVAFINSHKPSVWVVTHCLYNNSYDRLLKTAKTAKNLAFVHLVNEQSPEKAYIADFDKGLYKIYETANGIECWKESTPFDEHQLYRTHVLDTLTLESDTEFLFGDPSTLHETDDTFSFTLPSGTYEIEVGTDGDDEMQVLRIVRTDALLRVQDVQTLSEEVHVFLAEHGASLSIDACEALIHYIKNHKA